MTVLGWALFYLVLWAFIGLFVLVVRSEEFYAELKTCESLPALGLLLTLLLLIWDLKFWPFLLDAYSDDEDDEPKQ